MPQEDIESSLQETDLTAYTEEYWHPGYHIMTVQVKDKALFIDATDRSMGFTLKFDHLGYQTKFNAHLCNMYDGRKELLRAEFVMENGRATKLGLELESALKGVDLG
ncbi:hypothetical protein GE09DRAFT_1065065 [Coniochaeta sp. 2T2.1]|nr:hypothetical protein GE09DRAFT_1065065 [Coniochaeta sp. 2T2.1]